MYFKFKDKHSYEDRKDEANRILNKYPERIPIICDKNDKNNLNVPVLDKTKYLVPFDLTVGQFMFVLRKRMKLPSEQAIFLFVNGTIPSSSALVNELYHQHKDLDGFLYVSYSGENTFGNE